MKQLLFSTLYITLIVTTSAQTWTEVSSLPNNASSRNNPVTFSLNGYGYVATGYYNQNRELRYLNDVLKYDPNSDEWTTLDTFPGPARGFSYGVTTGGKAYMGFGLTSQFDSARMGYVSAYLDDLWSFDPETEEWKELASCPCEPRYHPAFIATEDKLFVGLGSSGIGNLRDWWEYDIATDTWSEKPKFPGVKRHHPYFFGIDSLVYAGFGHGAGIYKDFYAYNPKTEDWTRISDLPAEGRVAGTQFTYDGKGYALSGQGEDHLNLDKGEFWEYDATLDQWTDLPAHPGTGRWAPGSFLIGDTLYLTSGRTTTEEKDVWMFPLKTPIDHKGREDDQSLRYCVHGRTRDADRRGKY